jgi:hypothetical protein
MVVLLQCKQQYETTDRCKKAYFKESVRSAETWCYTRNEFMQRTNHNSINYVRETLRTFLLPCGAKVAKYLPEWKVFWIKTAQILRFFRIKQNRCAASRTNLLMSPGVLRAWRHIMYQTRNYLPKYTASHHRRQCYSCPTFLTVWNPVQCHSLAEISMRAKLFKIVLFIFVHR